MQQITKPDDFGVQFDHNGRATVMHHGFSVHLHLRNDEKDKEGIRLLLHVKVYLPAIGCPVVLHETTAPSFDAGDYMCEGDPAQWVQSTVQHATLAAARNLAKLAEAHAKRTAK